MKNNDLKKLIIPILNNALNYNKWDFSNRNELRTKVNDIFTIKIYKTIYFNIYFNLNDILNGYYDHFYIRINKSTIIGKKINKIYELKQYELNANFFYIFT